MTLYETRRIVQEADRVEFSYRRAEQRAWPLLNLSDLLLILF